MLYEVITSLDHFGIAADFLGSSLGDLLAVFHDVDAVGNVHHQLHVVLDEQDGVITSYSIHYTKLYEHGW